MTAFTKAQMPDSVDSVEKLVAWGTSILAELYPTPSIAISAGNAERVAQQSVYYFTANNPPTERLSNISYLPIAGTWRADKPWKSAQSLGTSSIPAAYSA